ncbi:MFS transporter [Vibrio mangrovi]|uniref:MFS transporter n=1 Tax=Vibrio mangrovi TaxID=474394 RepID=A0A1Y6IUH7_9VIBR|nr:MFS transporter [Vibrio mangrovi]MDW6001831.1 MFS transporter [Vibrio mangrovi]SMS00142.1 putative transporter [Vibrio mangrovi]
MKSTRDIVSFLGSSLSLVIIFTASATPIPLYGTYRSVDGLTYGDLSLSAVVYFAGALISLLLFGRLSNFWGRKMVSMLSLLIAAIGCITLIFVHDPMPLLTGRFMQGLSCGLASTAIAAWIVDSSSGVAKWLAPAVISCGPMTGLTFGGIGSGTLVEYGPYPRILPYIAVLALLVICILIITKGRETMTRQPGVLKSILPRLALPPSARQAYPAAACTFVCTWAVGGFFQAFGPAMAHEQLHSSSAVAAALVFASIMAPSVLGASIASRFRPVQAQIFGMLMFTASLGGLLLSLKFGVLVIFLITSALAGLAQGIVLTGSIQSMVSDLAPEERANVLSVVYATSYTGAAIPTLIAGQLSQVFSLLQVACAYGILAAVGCLFVLISVRLRIQSQNRAILVNK